MSIEVELFGHLLPDAPRKQILDTDASMLVREVANMIGLNPEEPGLIVIDGVQSEMEDVVKSGSRICFFPYLSGG